MDLYTRECDERNEELVAQVAALTDTLKKVTRYTPPDAYAPEGELGLDLSPVMNDRVLALLRASGL